ncbi:MAG: sigma-70 family RNA polymerase sigma factor [Planctomycetota bacterium]
MGERPLHLDDLTLSRSARRGDRAARDAFALRLQCVPAMLAAINSRLGYPLRPDELDDLVQDALAAIWSKIGTYEGRASLESWIYPFCLLETMSTLRRRKRRPDLVENLDERRANPGPASPEDFEDVYRGLERLSAPQGDVVRLRHFAQLTFDEMAHCLGLSINTVKTRYYRGLAQLRSILAPRQREDMS